MRIFQFGPEAAVQITRFDSASFVLSRVVLVPGDSWIRCAHLGSGGVIGFHQATVPQLFLVVEGTGWVRGEGPERVPVRAGLAAFWGKDEWHESGSESGMTAILIEGDSLDPASYMAEATI